MHTLDRDAPTAFITGGSRGIGKAIAIGMAGAGFQVILTYATRAGEAEAVVEQIAGLGGKALAFGLDVGQAEAIEALFASEIKDKVNLAVLVNNAGITHDGLLLRMKEEQFDRVLTVNLRGAFICTREAAKIMSKKRFGRIINISSVVGQMGNAGQVNYSAAKAGMIGLTKACAKELASRSITVNALAPGFIETEMTAALNENARKTYLEAIPMKRLGTVEDVAACAVFLASPGAGYITGQVIGINGGIYC